MIFGGWHVLSQTDVYAAFLSSLGARARLSPVPVAAAFWLGLRRLRHDVDAVRVRVHRNDGIGAAFLKPGMLANAPTPMTKFSAA